MSLKNQLWEIDEKRVPYKTILRGIMKNGQMF
jgi:hypothetical protein